VDSRHAGSSRVGTWHGTGDLGLLPSNNSRHAGRSAGSVDVLAQAVATGVDVAGAAGAGLVGQIDAQGVTRDIDVCFRIGMSHIAFSVVGLMFVFSTKSMAYLKILSIAINWLKIMLLNIYSEY
jgi:hypothetical protein